MTSHLNFAFAALALIALPATLCADEATKRAPGSDPYTLTTCPVSGEKLGGMGDPVVKVYEGREVRFCCGECVEDFDAEPAKHWKKIDAALIADQKPHYSLKTCAVSGTSLEKEGASPAIDIVLGNQLVRVCSAECETKARASAKETLAKVKAALAKAQLESYKLETCPISGGKLGGMGKPVDVVIASRLVRLCCKGCVPKLDKDPAAALAKLSGKAEAKKKHDDDDDDDDKTERDDDDDDKSDDKDDDKDDDDDDGM